MIRSGNFESWAFVVKGVDVGSWVGDETKREDYMGYLMEFRRTDASFASSRDWETVI